MPAASAALRPLLTGPTRPGRVVATGRTAIHLQIDGDPERDGDLDVGGEVVAVLGPGAVRLPVGVLLDRARFDAVAGIAVGAPALVGGGGLQLAGQVLQVRRWWPSLVPVVAGLAPGRDPADLVALVDPLVGLGPGLTPAGDDVLCGALAALAACGPSAAAGRDRVAARVRSRAGRTTALSASLLRRAADGHAIPELVALLRAMPRGAGVRPELDALRRVGHSSGPALALGAMLALGPNRLQGVAA